MQLGRFSLKLFLITITCFLLSYASSVLGNLNSEKSFPHSLFTKYTKTIGDAQSVEVERNFQSDDLTEIDIQTTQTDIELRRENTKQISVGLKGHYISQTAHPEAALQVVPQGSKLLVKTGESDLEETSFFHINGQQSDGKMLVVVSPQIKKIKIKTTSGDISINASDLESLSIETVSGDTLLSQTSAEELQLKSVSGGLAGTGNFAHVIAKSVSGGAKLKFLNTDPIVEFKSTSGDFQALFSEMPNLNLEYSSISGSFDLDSQFGAETKGSKHIQISLGKPMGKIMVNTISGDFKLGHYDKVE